MNEQAKSGVLGTAAMKVGMHRETATKYLAAGLGSGDMVPSNEV